MRCGLGIVSFILVLICTSCSSAVYVPLEVLRSPEIHLPDTIRVVAVIANAVERTIEQDEGSIIDPGNRRQRLQVQRDSLTPVFFKSMLRSLNEPSERSFSIVPVSGNLKKGNMLSLQQVQAIRDSLNADAILAFDGLSVVPSVHIDYIDVALFTGSLDVSVGAALRLYTGNFETPRSIVCKDTIFWQSYGETETQVLDRFPAFQNCLIKAAEYSGAQVSKIFYPYMESVDRYYFITSFPLMKDAESYWKKGEYENASYLWEYIYENTNKQGRKARAAANMALYEELNDRYADALEWLNRSLDIFSKSPDNYGDYIEYLSDYARQLNMRILETKEIN